MAGRIYIGTSGWSIPRASAARFAAGGTHLHRYARVLPCAEINSCFYRSHMPATYARWASSAGGDFRFAVKVPKRITHELRLRRSRAAFEQFLEDTNALGRQREPLLVQLPPSFEFDARMASAFFAMVRERYDGPMVLEPRHPTWFAPKPSDLLIGHRVARVAADPAIVDAAAVPGGWTSLAYFRLHGSPRMYWSRYDAPFLSRLQAELLRLAESADVWCIFDNTATGAALENACEVIAALAPR